MFEAITRSQPDDYQSLEILKEAYARIGRDDDALQVSRRLAEAYLANGQYTSAMLECEGILQRDPDSPGVVAMLSDLETRLRPEMAVVVPQNAGGTDADPGGPDVRPLEETPICAAPEQPVQDDPVSGTIGLDFGCADVTPDQGLVEMGVTGLMELGTGLGALELHGDGNDDLAAMLIDAGLAPAEAVTAALETVRAMAPGPGVRAVAGSLLDELGRSGAVSMDLLLCELIDRTGLPFIPLDQYEPDRQIGLMLPEALALGRLLVPFDIIGRTLLVAGCNPFDREAKAAAERSVDHHVLWYLAMPAAIRDRLGEIYGLRQQERD